MAAVTLGAAAGAGAGLAIDNRSLDALRTRAAADPKGAAREAAKQFEALFMNELMKTMRSSTMQSGMFDSPGGQVSTEMLDTQFATQLSGRAGGLSDAIMKQLERQMGLAPGPIPVTGSANNTAAPLAVRPEPTRIPQSGAAGFVQQHSSAARDAEVATGIPATFMVAQAAHETGWGRKEILHSDGSPSFNLFGIKAGADWKGPVAEVVTTEYVAGKAQKGVAKFRAYGSYAESFADYGRLMKESPRYQAVVNGVKAGIGTGSGAGAGSSTVSADMPRCSPRACSAPGTPPIRPTPTSSPASSTPRCACSVRWRKGQAR